MHVLLWSVLLVKILRDLQSLIHAIIFFSYIITRGRGLVWQKYDNKRSRYGIVLGRACLFTTEAFVQLSQLKLPKKSWPRRRDSSYCAMTGMCDFALGSCNAFVLTNMQYTFDTICVFILCFFLHRTSSCSSINDARVDLVVRKGRLLHELPPSKVALEHKENPLPEHSSAKSLADDFNIFFQRKSRKDQTNI